ncbi:hypothetical protein [Streptomyces sp. NBC_00083]|uniref:hypothetical protein n=1 Tax=Streptomyces sp. NBC_00083 TaxID=2975647 RepID=UPI002250D9A1|nr:hypothetical protein [Streptomyces sp. NBC_00083]MCX5387477.1 hypothetical protein [Streptomyces sp. NBC_00083]
MATEIEPESAVGRTFMEALNIGLARARFSAPHAGVRRAPRDEGLSDPFAAALLRSYEAALPTVLAPRDRGRVEVRSALAVRGRALLLQALDLAAGLPSNRRAVVEGDGLPPEYETVALTLLIECAALTALEGRGFPGSACRPRDLIRALGRSARAARERDTPPPRFPRL